MTMKNIVFFLLMALPFTAAQAQTIAEANQSVIDACGKAGGKMTKFTAGRCDFQRCIYKDDKSDGTFYRAGDNQRSNCSDAEMKKELEKIRDDLGLDLNTGSAGSGGRDGRSGRDGDNDGRNGGRDGRNGGRDGRDGSDTANNSQADGEVICRELEGNVIMTPNAPCYKACTTKPLFGRRKFDLGKKGCIDCLMANGYKIKPEHLPRDGRGNVRGAVTATGVTVGTGVIVCEWKPNAGNGRRGSFDHHGPNCPDGAHVHTSGGRSGAGPGGQVVIGGNTSGGNGGRTVVVGGNTSGNGNGTVVVGGNTSGSGHGGTVIVGGNGNGNGAGGTVVIGGGAGVSGQLPAFCMSDKKKDKKLCAEYLARQDRFRCAGSASEAACLRGAHVEIRSGSSADCVDCDIRRKRSGGGSSFAEIAGAVLPPLAMLGGAYFNSRAQIKSAEAWAGAAAVGFEQCQLDHNNYYNYLGSNELPGLSPEQQQRMGCNGFGLGQFAGLGGGFGGMGGYSQGFLGGMQGPYGMYNPYGGAGGMVGGAVGGMTGGGFVGGISGGGMVGGYPGGYAGGMAGGMYPGGYAGGMAGGMYPAGGMAGGMYPAGGMAGGLVQGGYVAAGMNGGMMYPAGGMAGGMYPGGYAGGMAAGGYVAGGMNGGMAGGYPGGMAGGLVQGGYVAAGMNGGYAAGGMAGGYPGGYAGGIAGGYAAGGMAGGYPGGYAGGMAGGYAAGGMAGGYPGGYAGGIAGGIGGGMGGYPGAGGYPGGWGSGVGTGGYGPGGYPGAGGYWGQAGGFGGLQASMQASSRDAQLQQQGVSYQMGMLSSGSMGAGGMSVGTAGFSPMNVGYGMSGGAGFYGM